MQILTATTFASLVKHGKVPLRLARELRFNTSTTGFTPEYWSELEIVAITDRSRTKGVLVLQPTDSLYVVPYELSRGLTASNGRAQAVICDFCFTWQAGSNAAAITFKKDRQSLNSTRLLCCADLRCSDHIRDKTTAARLSRANLRETMTNEQRIARLQSRVQVVVQNLELLEIPPAQLVS